MEHEKRSERRRFNDLTSQMLYRLAQDGWANQSSGSTECPMTGWFARISIAPDELPEIVEAFEEPMQGAGFVETESLLGHHLVLEDAAGVKVIAYRSEGELVGYYRVLEEAWHRWQAEAGL